MPVYYECDFCLGHRKEAGEEPRLVEYASESGRKMIVVYTPRGVCLCEDCALLVGNIINPTLPD